MAQLLNAWGRSSEDTDGADLVIEAVGNSSAVATSIGAVTRGGTVVLVGNVSPTIELPLQAVVTRQIRLQGSCASAGRYPEAIQLAADGRVDLSAFVSAVAPLAEGPAWFDRLHRRENPCLAELHRLDAFLKNLTRGIRANEREKSTRGACNFLQA
ncbi:MAG: zinc-binding dehydrogenase [Spartobacteria bacterium]